jgi:drug/metabolite transporter (DMT)-like permease
MNSDRKTEITGDLFILAELFLWSLYPILVVGSKDILPPIFFASISFFIAGISILVLLFLFKRNVLIFPREVWFPMAMGILFIAIIFYSLSFYAGQKTSPGNMAILAQSEVVFSFLFFGILGLERIRLKRVIGAVCILLGATVILSRQLTGTFVPWDLLIVFSTLFTPIGNYYQRQAVSVISPITYVAYRSIIGSFFLLLASLFFEQPNFSRILEFDAFILIMISGIFAFGISKWFWLEGIKRIGVAKSVAMTSTYPALTLLIAFFLSHEIPTHEQLIGLLFALIGVPLVVLPIKNKTFTGLVISGDKIGTKMGFPTINVHTEYTMRTGVYAVRTKIKNKWYNGVMHVGSRPTLNKSEYRTEIHIIDNFSETIPKKTSITVEVVQRLRRVRTFKGKTELKRQIKKDIQKARNFL